MPIRYNLRNLLRRKLRTALTIVGIALVIAIAVVMLAYSRGLLHAYRSNGDPDNALVISRRGTDQVFSSIKEAQIDLLGALLESDIANVPAEDADDEEDTIDLLAPFVIHSFRVFLADRSKDDPVVRRGIVIGVDPERVFKLHRDWRLVAGRKLLWDDEKVAMVGSLTYARLGLDPGDLEVGTVLRFGGAVWPIVGVFENPGMPADGEIWVPADELRPVLDRTTFNYVVLKAHDPATMRKIVDFVNRSDQVELRAVTEEEYYRGFAEGHRTFVWIGGIMALIITLGGVMVGMNTMYTAISGRIREIGMLQVIGFSRRAILVSFLLESVLIAAVGGALGCALGTLVNGLPMTVTMGVFLFRVDWLVLAIGFGLALVIGFVGALIPAVRAVRMPKVEAMRYA